ncbi:heterokaryon incompatibility protein-domain-containing protein, partial [Phaeosphaeria sp. MPI-PUGE-AT-0046c]
YQYGPLGPSEIRLMALQPGTLNEELVVNMEKMDLSDPCAYNALSYVWGQEPALHPLRVNSDTWLFIRSNLYHALRRMRHASSTIHIWVDAICINQSDLEERSLQVQCMRNVYCNA